ncbi:hypothetical protein ACNPKB_17025 [Shewanella marisflavi]|uniref:hypothetical protein n=1 Tax=Shewanella marisflavi TaxID=260364 RepID=UPI003AABA016
MFRHFFLVLLLIPSIVKSESLSINFTEGSFLGQYKHQTYVSSGVYTYIDEHFKADDTGMDILPYFPEVYSVTLSGEQITVLIDNLLKLGVNNWLRQYPEDSSGLICDGRSYNLYIKSARLNVNSRGYCYFPNNFNEVVSLLESVHKTPNKKINKDT